MDSAMVRGRWRSRITFSRLVGDRYRERLCKVAGRKMSIAHQRKGWPFLGAKVLGQRAARTKSAAGRDIARARNVTLQDDTTHNMVWIGPRHSRQQRLRVGVVW